jgi:hypothetical protein
MRLGLCGVRQTAVPVLLELWLLEAGPFSWRFLDGDQLLFGGGFFAISVDAVMYMLQFKWDLLRVDQLWTYEFRRHEQMVMQALGNRIMTRMDWHRVSWGNPVTWIEYDHQAYLRPVEMPEPSDWTDATMEDSISPPGEGWTWMAAGGMFTRLIHQG